MKYKISVGSYMDIKRTIIDEDYTAEEIIADAKHFSKFIVKSISPLFLVETLKEIKQVDDIFYEGLLKSLK